MPVYNEGDNIAPLYNKIKNVCSHNQYCYELIFINDGSNDNSQKILDGLATEDSNCKDKYET